MAHCRRTTFVPAGGTGLTPNHKLAADRRRAPSPQDRVTRHRVRRATPPGHRNRSAAARIYQRGDRGGQRKSQQRPTCRVERADAAGGIVLIATNQQTETDTMLDAATAISATALSAWLRRSRPAQLISHKPQQSRSSAPVSAAPCWRSTCAAYPSGTRGSIERSHLHGTGLAYSTQHQGHLLNVPAEKMSSEQPLDFLHWLQLRAPEELDGVQPAAGAFVPRGLYGAYIRSHLQQVLMDPATRKPCPGGG